MITNCWICNKNIKNSKKIMFNITFCNKPTPYFLCDKCAKPFNDFINMNLIEKHKTRFIFRKKNNKKIKPFYCSNLNCKREISYYQNLKTGKCQYCNNIIKMVKNVRNY